MVCPVCGKNYEVNTVGRPKEVCCGECGDVNKFFNAFQDRILNIENMGTKARKKWKGELFSLSNLL